MPFYEINLSVSLNSRIYWEGAADNEDAARDAAINSVLEYPPILEPEDISIDYVAEELTTTPRRTYERAGSKQ